MKALVISIAVGAAAFLPQTAISADEPASQSSASLSETQKQIRSLKWIEGPKHVTLYDNSALEIPDGYVFLDPEETNKLKALTHNLGDGKQYFLAPRDLRWEAYFDYRDDGYVKDDQKIDSDAIMESIKKGTEAANKERQERGWHQLQVTGWQTAPHYDSQTQHLEWAIDGKDLVTNASIINFNTRILGRGGVMSVLLLSDPEHFDSAIAEFKSTLSQFSYLPGQRYAEYKPGDKIAKYGLAALITGGAAAIAVKTGFWKVLVTGLIAGWKFIAAAAVALFSGISRFFKRKKT